MAKPPAKRRKQKLVDRELYVSLVGVYWQIHVRRRTNQKSYTITIYAPPSIERFEPVRIKDVPPSVVKDRLGLFAVAHLVEALHGTPLGEQACAELIAAWDDTECA